LALNPLTHEHVVERLFLINLLVSDLLLLATRLTA
jgi:hypothetical protein